ncbi:MAG: bifunctional folylpolyglutamate synthase/dihydrofolate synthase [Ignavibacteriales bacterium]|nr:bifunctional folylpolyglutamate synthase/dihydrofolate synthase [Ignavibacteriales bacterium]
MKFGLRNIRRILRRLGNPERKYRSIHVAGSNGKGSTAAMLAAILTAAGYRTGLYTSPHLISFTERIRIDGKSIPRGEVVRLASQIEPAVERYGLTFFEATTALAFKYFADRKIDVAVVETGLGGRLDATNVLRPLASVITEISLEHTRILGNSVKKIAYEKAGIIKTNGLCVTGVTSSRGLRVIRETCRKRRARLVTVASSDARVIRSTLRGSTILFGRGSIGGGEMFVSLPGLFQAENAAIALACLRKLGELGVLKVDERAVRKGLSAVEELTGLRGRLSVLSGHPRLVVDVAHNPSAIRNLVSSLQHLGVVKVILLFGVMKDKQVSAMVKPLGTVVRKAVVVQPQTDRACPAVDLVRIFRNRRIPVIEGGKVQKGLRRARRAAGSMGTVLVTGSHFVVGEALAALEGKKYLTINQ